MGSGGNSAKTALNGLSDTVEGWRKDPWGSIVGGASQLFMGTFAKYNLRTGKPEAGSAFHRFDEIVGELNGRNKGRIAQYKADDLLRQQQATAATNLTNQRNANQQSDTNASNQAAALRNTATAQNNAAFGTPNPGGTTTVSPTSTPAKDALGGLQKDFLGL